MRGFFWTAFAVFNASMLFFVVLETMKPPLLGYREIMQGASTSGLVVR